MLKRAWILVKRDRTVFEENGRDGFPPDRLVERLRELCFGVGHENSATCMFAQTYGRADIVVAAEWDSQDPGRRKSGLDELAPLDEAVMAIDHPLQIGEDRTAGVATTETLIRLAPSGPRPEFADGRSLTSWDATSEDERDHSRRLLQAWGDRTREPLAAFVGVKVKSGQYEETMDKIVRRLDRCELYSSVADAVFGSFDIFIAMSVPRPESRPAVQRFMRLLREVPGIRRTETLLSQSFVFPD